MMTTYIEELKQEIAPKKSNYVKFANNEKKILMFGDKEDRARMYTIDPWENDPKQKRRMRFVVEDLTNRGPKPATEETSNEPIYYMWDVSQKWANVILAYLERNEPCLEIERQGTGTDTNYIIFPARLD